MRPHNWKQILILAVSLIFLCCDRVHAQAPTITSISPTSGPVGSPVAITGTNFGTSQGTSSLSLNGKNAVATAWSSTSITAIVPSGAASGAFSVTVNGHGANSSTFTVTGLPSGWTDADVGTVGLAGSASYANNVFTVNGAGNGEGGTTDGLNFLYQSLSGNGTIIARVASVSSVYAQAGVMIRETLNAGATHAFMMSYVNAMWSYDRATTGANTSYQGTRPANPSSALNRKQQ